MHAKRSLPPEQSDQLATVLEAAGKHWLLNRSVQWGLAIREHSVLQNGYRQQKLVRKGFNIEFSTLDYQGVAEVVDPDRLNKALVTGVGHSKGFGCGLLLIKPMR